MPPEILRTGFVRANAYDIKVRKVLFAQVRRIIQNDEILRAAAELNQKIFEELQKRNVEKRDVIRVSINYEIKEGKIVWRWDTLKMEVYREVEEVGSKLSSLLEEIERKEEQLKDLVERLHSLSETIRNLTYELDELTNKIEELR